MSDLPRDRVTDYDGHLARCPWCGSLDIELASISLENLVQAWCCDVTARPKRTGGPAECGALTVDCPACGRPSMIALQRHSGVAVVRLLAVRTEKDVRLLVGEPS